MSREIVREQGQVALLGNMRSDARLAAFLLELSEKFAARGYSATDFLLRMTRDDIGSYLGVTLETISRALSRLQEQGLITAKLRSIAIVDVARLRRLVPEL
jgi:CRP/FNR family transcriptional regulator